MSTASGVTPRWVARTVVLAIVGAVASVLCERLLRRSPLLGVLLSALLATLVLLFVARRMKRAGSSSTDRVDVTLALAYVGALGTFLGQRLATRSLVAAAVAALLLAVMAVGLLWANARSRRPAPVPVAEAEPPATPDAAVGTERPEPPAAS